jgi:hypothetical protein
MALTLHALSLEPDLPRELLLANITAEEKERILQLFARRITQRVPAAYLTGYGWFAGLRFRVDDRVLVPRSPIAELIESGFEPWMDAERVPGWMRSTSPPTPSRSRASTWRSTLSRIGCGCSPRTASARSTAPTT